MRGGGEGEEVKGWNRGGRKRKTTITTAAKVSTAAAAAPASITASNTISRPTKRARPLTKDKDQEKMERVVPTSPPSFSSASTQDAPLTNSQPLPPLIALRDSSLQGPYVSLSLAEACRRFPGQEVRVKGVVVALSSMKTTKKFGARLTVMINDGGGGGREGGGEDVQVRLGDALVTDILGMTPMAFRALLERDREAAGVVMERISPRLATLEGVFGLRLPRAGSERGGGGGGGEAVQVLPVLTSCTPPTLEEYRSLLNVCQRAFPSVGGCSSSSSGGSSRNGSSSSGSSSSSGNSCSSAAAGAHGVAGVERGIASPSSTLEEKEAMVEGWEEQGEKREDEEDDEGPKRRRTGAAALSSSNVNVSCSTSSSSSSSSSSSKSVTKARKQEIVELLDSDGSSEMGNSSSSDED